MARTGKRNAIWAAMWALGFTVKTLAVATGIPYSRLDRMLSGLLKVVADDEVARIATALEMAAAEVRAVLDKEAQGVYIALAQS